MISDAKWIWLSPEDYPRLQSAPYTYYCDKNDFDGYCTVEISRAYRFMKTAVSLHIDVCADTIYRLWINSNFVGSGPVYSGGDNGSTIRMKKRYYSSYDLPSNPETLTIRALVRKNPTIMAESSAGVGGFILSCEVEYDDGTTENISTDDTWSIRVLRSRISDSETDFTKAPTKWGKAVIIRYPVELEKSPIPNLQEEEVQPQNKAMFVCPPYSSARFCVEFDRIYSAYALLQCSGEHYTVYIGAAENEDSPVSREKITAKGKIDYFSMQYGSYGKMIIDVENFGAKEVKISNASLLFRRYPVSRQGRFLCSDDKLNRICDLCSNTLEICRQDLHLDSPRHREPLGCTGDYYVQSLMEYFVFGDTELARFDIVRTGDYLLQSGGTMFHTSYSLIWVMMMYDYYTYTADESIFDETRTAMRLLFDKFSEYVGSSGLIENAPNYMFLDWKTVDGYSLHHPPKALGQAYLNAFYYHALDLASKICAITGNNRLRSSYRIRADAVKKSFNEYFFDSSKGLYFSGLGTRGEASGEWLPENTRKRFFIRHVNVLAALFGLYVGTPERSEVDFAEKVLSDRSLGGVQPYFMHFVLDLVHKYDLFDKYGFKMLHLWKTLVDECPKGLAEGWNGFEGDHSHAWGGTPAYQLPRTFLGLEMIKPGFGEITLSPRLYGLDYAHITVPTPYGMIDCEMRDGAKPIIKVPKKIKYTIV